MSPTPKPDGEHAEEHGEPDPPGGDVSQAEQASRVCITLPRPPA